MSSIEVLGRMVAAADRICAEPVTRGLGSQAAEELDLLFALRETIDVAILARLAAVDADGGVPGHASTAAWVSQHCPVSLGRARALVHLAGRVHGGGLQATAQALGEHRITCEQAAVIEHGTRGMNETHTAGTEEILLALAPRVDLKLLREAAVRARALSPAGEQAEARWARQQGARGFDLIDVGDMVHATGLLDPETGALLRTALAALDDHGGPDELRTASQRRHDALGELARRTLTSGTVGMVAGQRPHLQLLVEHGQFGGRLRDGGMIDPHTLERLACDAEVTVTVMGSPQGADAGLQPGLLRQILALLPPALGGLARDVLDQGHLTRLASPAQLRALAARDGGCIAPGCQTRPEHCHAHHIQHWLHGGSTDLENLALVCSRHHHLLHEADWHIHNDNGHRILVPPNKRRHQQAA